MAGHWIQPVRQTTGPRTLLSLAYDPVDVPTGGGAYVTVASSWSWRLSSRSGTTWTALGTGTVGGDRARELWDVIDDIGRKHSRVYVVCRVASDVMTLAGLWERVDGGEVSLRLESDTCRDRDGKTRKRKPHPLILSGDPDVIGWSHAGAEFRAVSCANHLKVPILDLGRAGGIPDPPDSRMIGRPSGHADPDSQWTCHALTACYERLISWWIGRSAGKWCDTIGSAAYQWWRTTLAPKSVLSHDQPDAKSMERAAIHGGRAQLFWFGSAGADGKVPADEAYLEPAVPIHIPGCAFKLDIRSMYAHILATRRFPCRLSHRIHFATPDSVSAACEHFDVIARCRVRLETPSLPYTDQLHGTVYPTGEWWAVLTTPEIVAAHGRGEIVAVGDAWAYVTGHPFREFAEELLDQRAHARDKGDKVGESVCKGIANALGGRLARTFRGWTTVPSAIAMQRWGEWIAHDTVRGTPVRRRGVAGMCQEFMVRDERAGGLAGMFAHLTAYGRVLLGDIIQEAGIAHVYWCDTDGLIVSAAGANAVAAGGYAHGDTPGSLRVVEEVRRFAGRTPKHYQAGGAWTLAGARGDWSPIDGHAVRCYVTANPVRSGQRPHGRSIPTASQVYHLDAIPLSGVPDHDGWLIHPRVESGVLVQPKPKPLTDIDQD